MFKLIFTQSYEKRAARFLKKHRDLESIYKKTLQLLEINPYHPSLRLHTLTGNNDGLHSVSINLKYRITLEFLMSEKMIIPVNVGSHDQVY